jgi:RNA polymerase sigma-70 factor, ECF subfamily
VCTRVCSCFESLTLATDATERTLPITMLRAPSTRARTHAPDEPSDEELLAQVGEGQQDALLALFHRYSRLVFSIGCRILKDEGEAEDLVQEIFLRLRIEQAYFNPAKGSGRTWLVQMFYRRAFDRRGYLSRRHFYSGTDLEKHTNALVGARNLEKDVIERLTAQQLLSAFDQLTDRQKLTLELFFLEGLKLTEIAKRIDEDVSNVRHHYYRGLERLKQVAQEMLKNEKRDRS